MKSGELELQKHSWSCLVLMPSGAAFRDAVVLHKSRQVLAEGTVGQFLKHRDGVLTRFHLETPAAADLSDLSVCTLNLLPQPRVLMRYDRVGYLREAPWSGAGAPDTCQPSAGTILCLLPADTPLVLACHGFSGGAPQRES